MKNIALFADFYEFSMANAYFIKKINPKAKFEVFFRMPPFNNGYTILSGISSLVEILSDFHFKKNETNYLNSLKCFDEKFINYLSNLNLNVAINAIDEGRVVFPYEPILSVNGNLIELLLIEGLVLNILNFESLIATKTARIKESGAKILAEFGLRRAQGLNGAITASKAAYIGGGDFTSNVLAGYKYNIPLTGTMSHSWVMSFDSELEAFRKYSEIYPNKTSLLIDTYNTLESGIKNAIIVFKELKQKGCKNFSVRIDSGDLEYLSKAVRKKLNENNLNEVKIIASNELDENIIMYLSSINAPIDIWGVGTNLITAKGTPALSGVYKINSILKDGKFIPKMKVSNNIEKSTLPSEKEIVRIYNKNQMITDIIFLKEEKEKIKNILEKREEITIYHPVKENILKTLKEYDDFEFLIKKVLANGKVIKKYSSSDNLQKSRERVKKDIKKLDGTYKRIINPHIYKVSITENLKNLKNKLSKEIK